MHDDVMQEQRLVVDFYVSRQEAVEVSHVPAENREAELSAAVMLYEGKQLQISKKRSKLCPHSAL